MGAVNSWWIGLATASGAPMMGAIITLASGGCGAMGAAAIGSGGAAAFEPNREMALSHPPSPRAASIMTMASARGRGAPPAAAAPLVLPRESPPHPLFPAQPHSAGQ